MASSFVLMSRHEVLPPTDDRTRFLCLEVYISHSSTRSARQNSFSSEIPFTNSGSQSPPLPSQRSQFESYPRFWRYWHEWSNSRGRCIYLQAHYASRFAIATIFVRNLSSSLVRWQSYIYSQKPLPVADWQVLISLLMEPPVVTTWKFLSHLDNDHLPNALPPIFILKMCTVIILGPSS